MRSGAGTRTRRGRANDEVILDAALDAAYLLGLDAIGLKDVAHSADLTTGALYGRYEGVGELQADLWRERLLPEVRDLLADVRQAIDDGFSSASVEQVLRLSPARTLALFACAIAPRTDELGDLVPDDLHAALSEQRLLPSQASNLELGFVSLVIGIHLHAQREVDGQIPPGECSALLRDAPTSVRGEQPEPALPPEPRFSIPEDPAREKLVNALARVVARSGLHRATVRRIARAAGSSHTAVYSHYSGVQELVEDFVRTVGNTRPAPSAVAERYLNLNRLCSHLLGGLKPEAKTLRRLSLEFLVGVSPHPELSALVNEFDEERYEETALTFTTRSSKQFHAFKRLGRATRAINFGSMLLEDSVGGMDDFDLRPILSAFLRPLTD